LRIREIAFFRIASFARVVRVHSAVTFTNRAIRRRLRDYAIVVVLPDPARVPQMVQLVALLVPSKIPPMSGLTSGCRLGGWGLGVGDGVSEGEG